MVKGVDYYSSFEPKELKQFVEDVRLVEKSIGSLDFNLVKLRLTTEIQSKNPGPLRKI